ncbi:MAG: hypothetical protein ACOCP8_07400 [archaeon]
MFKLIIFDYFKQRLPQEIIKFTILHFRIFIFKFRWIIDYIDNNIYHQLFIYVGNKYIGLQNLKFTYGTLETSIYNNKHKEVSDLMYKLANFWEENENLTFEEMNVKFNYEQNKQKSTIKNANNIKEECHYEKTD